MDYEAQASNDRDTQNMEFERSKEKYVKDEIEEVKIVEKPDKYTMIIQVVDKNNNDIIYRKYDVSEGTVSDEIDLQQLVSIAVPR